MRYLLFALSLFFFGTLTLHAQNVGSITGTVVNEAGEPLVGAIVRVEGVSLGAMARGPHGRYVINGVKSGDVTIRIGMIGYKHVTRTVTVTPGASTEVEPVRMSEIDPGWLYCPASRSMIEKGRTGTMHVISGRDLW